MGFLTWFANVITTNADKEIDALENKNETVKTKISETREKLRGLWSYGNQIATMILQNAAQAAEGTRLAAISQSIIAGLQFAQSEFAVIQATLQMKLALDTGNIPQAVALFTIIGLLQANVVKAQINQLQAARAEKRANEITRQIAAYKN